jgi:hypothetical protein
MLPAELNTSSQACLASHAPEQKLAPNVHPTPTPASDGEHLPQTFSTSVKFLVPKQCESYSNKQGLSGGQLSQTYGDYTHFLIYVKIFLYNSIDLH